MDYSIEGNKNFLTVCKHKNIDSKKIINKLVAAHKDVYYLQNYNSWKLDFLIEFLSEIHHNYKEENILILKQYSKKVADLYSKQYPELLEVNNLIQGVSEEILEHMKNEETILFPYLNELLKLENASSTSKYNSSKKLKIIDSFEDEHYKIRKTFQKIATLTNYYILPENICNSFKLLYIKLKNFDDRLQEHIHIENNILFPKAKKLQFKVFSKKKEYS
ncbi:MAG: hemerythrin domain-containing protein [Polaribacter sp.]